MAYEFSPRIYNANTTTLTSLPKPILSCRLPTVWSFDTHKVPLKDGGVTYGHSKNPHEIQITGSFGKVDASYKISEEDMWTTYTTLMTQLDLNPSSTKHEFFLYYDLGTTTYVKFKSVYPIQFDVDFGDDEHIIWPYTLVLGVDDNTIYTTAPGA